MEGKPIKVKRPGIFFDPKGNMPGEITFSLKKPDCFKDTSNKDFKRILNERIRQREREIQKEFLLKGKTFLGKEKILAQSPFATPKTAEKKKEINPRLICKDKWNRIMILSFLKVFFEKYKEAIKKFKEGDKNVVFPYGTYKMRVFFGFKCEENPLLSFENTS